MNATIGNPRRRNLEVVHGHLLVAALGVVALGLLLGVGAWQAFGGGEAETRGASTPAVSRSVQGDVPLTIYIVANEAQQEGVLLAEVDAEMVRYANGETEPAPEVDVIVVTGAPQFERVVLDVATANRIREDQGLAPMAVVDLR